MLNSNVIKIKKLKDFLISNQESWSGDKKSFRINVRNESNICIHLRNVVVNLGTSVRYIEVFGVTGDNKEYIIGTHQGGYLYDAAKNTIDKTFSDIFFDVRKYDHVEISVQMNEGQSLDMFVDSEMYSEGLFFKKEYGNYTKTFLFNVIGRRNCMIQLTSVNIVGTTAVRYLKVKGIVEKTDEGEYIQGIDYVGRIIDAKDYTISEENSITYNVDKYQYLKVTIQLNPNQSLNAKILYDVDEKQYEQYDCLFGKFATNGQKYMRFKGVIKVTESTPSNVAYSVKGYDYEGNDVVLQMASSDGTYNNTTNSILKSYGNTIDSYVDVSKCKYVEVSSTAKQLFVGGYVRFFNDVDNEFFKRDLITPSRAVRGFRFVKIKINSKAVYNFFYTREDSVRIPLRIYGQDGIFKGHLNTTLNVGIYVLDTVDFDKFAANDGSYTMLEVVNNFHVPDKIVVSDNNGVKILKVNDIVPNAVYGKYKMYHDGLSGIMKITDSGKDFYGCEYEANVDTFPNISNKALLSAAFIPWTRNLNYNHNGMDIRLCVQFQDGKIYHNFPKRAIDNDGSPLDGDIAVFDESVVWDSPISVSKIKFPCKTLPLPDEDNYYYDPTLQEDNYVITPALNQDNGFGHGGFGISFNGRVRMRQQGYIDLLRGLNNIEIDKMYSAVDSYRNPIKNCMFETHDGGRQWFVQCDLGSAEKTFGSINTNGLSSYTGGLSVKKITINIPSSADKDPENKFTLGEAISISSIALGESPDFTASGHSLSVGDRVVLTGSNSEYNFMTNNEYDENSAGNGKVYKVVSVSGDTFKIEPLAGNVNTNIYCRHVHSVNRIKDGWILCCGEEYPNGWIMYIEQKARDFYSVATSSHYRNIVRLTSTKESIQRCVGALVLDDDNVNPTVIVSIDTFNIKMPDMKVGDRIVYSQSSGGIRIGKFNDLDDFSKFNSIVDMDDSGIGMKRVNDTIYCYGGGSGRYAVSLDNGKTWKKGKWTDSGYHIFLGIKDDGEIILGGGIYFE